MIHSSLRYEMKVRLGQPTSHGQASAATDVDGPAITLIYVGILIASITTLALTHFLRAASFECCKALNPREYISKKEVRTRYKLASRANPIRISAISSNKFESESQGTAAELLLPLF